MLGKSLAPGKRGVSRERVIAAATCVAAAVGLLSAGCENRNAYVPPPPPRVIVATPEIKTETIYHEFPGNTQASQAVSIVPRVQGYIDSIHFTDGAMVAKGQLLFIIDPRPYQDAYDVAHAQVGVAESAANVAKANYARALQVAKTPGAIAQQEVDTYKATEQQGEANLELARANQASAKLNLDFTHITAPVSGKISRRLVDIGNLVNANLTLLTTIDQYDPMYAYFNVSEADFLAYMQREREALEKSKSPPSSPGQSSPPQNSSPPNSPQTNSPQTNSPQANSPQQNSPQQNSPPQNSQPTGPQYSAIGVPVQPHPVEMGLSDETGYPHRGVIDFADNQVNPATGTLLVRGVFPNPIPYRLAPGLFVRIRVPIGSQPNAVLVPDRALGTDQQGKYLLIVESDDAVEHRAVVTGALVENDTMRIIEHGLNLGERFIVEGLQFARPGAKVNPVTESAAAAAGDSQQQPTGSPPSGPAESPPIVTHPPQK